MYQEVLRGVEGIGIFPVVSLVLFVLVFTLAVGHALRMDRDGVRRLSALPLEDREESR